MPEIREHSDYYTKLALQVLEDVPELKVDKEHIKLTVLVSDYEKKSQGRLIFGLTEKVPSKNQWAIDADFTITIYTKNIDKYNFDEKQKYILMYHELLHIGADKDGRTFIKPHDLEDFRVIIDKFGAYWDEANYE